MKVSGPHPAISANNLGAKSRAGLTVNQQFSSNEEDINIYMVISTPIDINLFPLEWYHSS